MASSQSYTQADPAYGRTQAAQVGGLSHQRFHSGCAASPGQGGGQPGQVPRPSGQGLGQSREETAAAGEGGSRQAVSQL